MKRLKARQKAVILVLAGAILGQFFLPVPSVFAISNPPKESLRPLKPAQPVFPVFDNLAGLGISVLFCEFSGEAEDLIGKGLDALKKGIKGILGIGGGGLTGGGQVPTHVKEDDPKEKNEAKKCFTAAVQRQLIRFAVNDVMNFVRGNGLPRYITNFPDVLTDAADRAGALIVSDLLGRNICTPFKPIVEILVQRAAFPRDTFSRGISCTLSDAFGNNLEQLERFKDDFRDGGWRAWISLHETQNTLLGAYLIADGERQRIFEVETEAAKTQAQAAQGFRDVTRCREVVFTYTVPVGLTGTPIVQTSPKTDLGGPIEVGSEEWQKLIASKGATSAICTKAETVTPGATVASQVNKAVGAQLDNLVKSEEWQGVVREVMTALISDVLKNGFPDL